MSVLSPIFHSFCGMLLRVRMAFLRPPSRPQDIHTIAFWCPHGVGDFSMLLPHLANTVRLFSAQSTHIDLYLTSITHELLQALDHDILRTPAVSIVIVHTDYQHNLRNLTLLRHLRKQRYDLIISSYYTSDIVLFPLMLSHFRSYCRFTRNGILQQNLVPGHSISLDRWNLRLLFASMYLFFERYVKGQSMTVTEVDLSAYQYLADKQLFLPDGVRRPATLVMYGRYYKAGKSYPLSKYHDFVRLLRAKKLPFETMTLLLGTNDYQNLSGDNRALLKDIEACGVKVVVSSSLDTTLTLLRQTRYYVGPDGGGTHLALLGKVPTMIVFFDGGVVPSFIIPEQHAAHALVGTTLDRISPEEVLAKLEHLVKKG